MLISMVCPLVLYDSCVAIAAMPPTINDTRVMLTVRKHLADVALYNDDIYVMLTLGSISPVSPCMAMMSLSC
jgi:hypothetical protein